MLQSTLDPQTLQRLTEGYRRATLPPMLANAATNAATSWHSANPVLR